MQRSALLLALVLAAGCRGGGPPAGLPLAPDFLLLDVNPNSATFDAGVSPRDRIGFVSGWYFGDAT